MTTTAKVVGESSPLADLGWAQIQEAVASRCRTARGAHRARGLEPTDDCDDAMRRVAAIQEVRDLAAAGVELSFGGITDVLGLADAAAKGATLGDEKLVAIAACARGVRRLAACASEHHQAAPELARMAQAIVDLRGVGNPIDDAYGDDGLLCDEASPQLGALRRELTRARNALTSRLGSIVAELGEYLSDQFYTQRGDRFVVPVAASKRSRVPGIVHARSQTGQTVFVEPSAIVDLGNRLTLAEAEVRAEEERIRRHLSAVVGSHRDELHTSIEAATRIDLIHAGALLAEKTKSTRPLLSSSGEVDLRAARHPHLVLAGKQCVANDIRIAAGQILIISGPNAGGKTVALKTVGLAQLMLRAGLHILAETGSAMPFFTNVLTDIGDAQSLEHDLSTFSGHVRKLQSFVDASDDRALILVDEIAVGTEPEQGAALAQSILEALATSGATAVVTSHYERLKELAVQHPCFANASVGYDMEGLAPTFELHLGAPGSSGAFVVARQLGMSASIVDRAEELAGESRRSVEEVLLELMAQRKLLADREEELADATARADRERQAAVQEQAAAKAERKRAAAGAFDEAVAALREARVELDRAKRSVRKREGKQVKDIEVRVDSLARTVREHAPEPVVEGEHLTGEELTSGMRVYVASLGAYGVIEERSKDDGVVVRVGAMRTTVASADLRKKSGQRPSPKRKSASPDYTVTKSQPGERTTTVDLRGARVEEGIAALDRALDGAVLGDVETLYVVHGHGTGALRKAVREFVRRHASVVISRPGERHEGGDGVTVLSLGT